MPGLTQEALLTNVELYGTQVIPRVRELWRARRSAAMQTEARAEGAECV
jgi:hypothetical protein